MLEVVGRWYRRKFSDPDSVTLLLLLIMAFVIMAFWGDILTPVLVAFVIAYLLDWPVVKLAAAGLGRTYASIVVMVSFIGISTIVFLALLPLITRQSANLIREAPQIWEQGQNWLLQLPERYPDYVQFYQIRQMLEGLYGHIALMGEQLISLSFSSLVDVAAVLIYFIVVPLMVLFMLKDKHVLLSHFSHLLPRERRLIKQVGSEMNAQIANYIRGKVIEIIIVAAVTAFTFTMLELRYSVLLGVLVGFSVLVPYIGAAVVTLPVAIVALFQWGITPDFGYVMAAYLVIQILDGNVLVPLLFSEAVSLHPVYIIIAVLFFGGLWGFWGVFFAIPLATLVKAVYNAWSSNGTQPD